MPRSLKCFLLLLGLTAVGCNQCGERRKLFPRLHDRLDGDNSSSRRDGDKDCCPNGSPVSRNGAGFGGETLSYPGLIVYPSGQPYPTNPRSDELPQPGGYIPNPGLPSNPYAQPRSIDSTKMLPKTGGTMTGDPRK